MKLLTTLMLLLSAIGATGCAAGSGVLLAGTYTGLLPCADCSGILTQVLLSKDGSVVITSRYEGKDNDVFTDRGRWHAENGIITATVGSETLRYKILPSSRIMLVGADGQASASMPEAYILTKIK